MSSFRIVARQGVRNSSPDIKTHALDAGELAYIASSFTEANLSNGFPLANQQFYPKHGFGMLAVGNTSQKMSVQLSENDFQPVRHKWNIVDIIPLQLADPALSNPSQITFDYFYDTYNDQLVIPIENGLVLTFLFPAFTMPVTWNGAAIRLNGIPHALRNRDGGIMMDNDVIPNGIYQAVFFNSQWRVLN